MRILKTVINYIKALFNLLKTIQFEDSKLLLHFAIFPPRAINFFTLYRVYKHDKKLSNEPYIGLAKRRLQHNKHNKT